MRDTFIIPKKGIKNADTAIAPIAAPNKSEA